MRFITINDIEFLVLIQYLKSKDIYAIIKFIKQ